jgi:UDP-N-acetylmuramate--alanine ligase
MSAIARYLSQMGHRVSGCDLTDTAMLVKLRDEGIDVVVGHDPGHLDDRPDFVSVATAVSREMPEIAKATELGIPVLSRGETMRLVVASKPRVAVISGTHGKTTTSSMVVHALRESGAAPSFFVGGVLNSLGTNAEFDSAGEWLIVEGDESDHSFLDFRRDAALVTNIEADHLDRWRDDFDALVAGFEEFIDGARLGAVLCLDDPHLARLAATRPTCTTYGYATDAEVRAVDYRPTPTGCEIDVSVRGEAVGTIPLQLRGRDMAQNAVGALALAHHMGVSIPAAAEALATFAGVARRFEYRGTHNGVECFDDYAHTSTEVRTTLARAREGGWTRVIALFQPHRYSRISRHWQDFGEVFTDADVVVVAGLDPAFEAPIPGVSSELIVQAIRAHDERATVISRPVWEHLADLPWSVGQPGDCIVSLGCGTITNVHDDWARIERQRAGIPA